MILNSQLIHHNNWVGDKMEHCLNDINDKLPIEVKWISWDNNGFGILKEVKRSEKNNNEIQFVIKSNDERVGDMIFRANLNRILFNTYQKMFRTFSWSIQLISEEKFWTEMGEICISDFQ